MALYFVAGTKLPRLPALCEAPVLKGPADGTSFEFGIIIVIAINAMQESIKMRSLAT